MGHPAHFARREDSSMRDPQVQPRSRGRRGYFARFRISVRPLGSETQSSRKRTDSLAVNPLYGAGSGPRVVFWLVCDNSRHPAFLRERRHQRCDRQGRG
jgi:hypothetical protein